MCHVFFSRVYQYFSLSAGLCLNTLRLNSISLKSLFHVPVPVSPAKCVQVQPMARTVTLYDYRLWGDAHDPAVIAHVETVPFGQGRRSQRYSRSLPSKVFPLPTF